jgi:serine/threonine-protein kinase
MPMLEPGVPTRSQLTGFDFGGNGWRLAISPDGRWIVSTGSIGGGFQLYARRADDTEWRLLAGTGGGLNPTFSPDGQSVAFDVSGRILKVPITGGPALPVADGTNPHWGVDGTIVYQGTGSEAGLYRVAGSGGEPELLLRSDTLQVVRPHLLPNGKAAVFGTAGAAASRIMLLEIETARVRQLVAAGTNPRYVPTGHIVYGHGDGALMGVPFDLETLEVTGPPITLLPQLAVGSGGSALFAVSETGTLIYDGSLGTEAGSSVLVEVSLDGVESPLPLAPAGVDAPRYSPDGRSIAYSDRPTNELRIYDLATGNNPQFASGGYPVWSTTGEYLYFSYPITGPGVTDGYRRRADGSAPEEQLWSVPGGEMVADVGAGDSLIAVRWDGVGGAGRDIRMFRPGAADSEAFGDLLVAEWREINAEISPDGRWLAYQSDESGEFRVYVHSFPVITGRRPVSPGLGADPIWAPDGRTLYYRSAGRVMAVDVRTDPDFAVLSAPRELFDRPEYTVWQNPGPQRTWDIHPDGTRFIVVKSDSSGPSDSQVYLVTDWFEELRQRIGS